MEKQKELESILGYSFKNSELLKTALMHPSYANEKGLKEDNQRLEFLGDAVLGLIITEYLYKKYPDKQEGHMSKLKSVLVSRHVLADLAKTKRLNEFLLLGAGESKSKGYEKPSNLADVFESLIGAIYLDSGMDEVKILLADLMAMDVNKQEKHKNYKSVVQELAQAKFGRMPQYKVIKEEGPEHEKFFTIEVSIGKKYKARGQGKTKKSAEQMAGKIILEMIKNDEQEEDEN